MSHPPRGSSALVIATRNRADHLLETVESIARQTVLPGELCIVDSSDDEPATRGEIEQLCATVRLPLIYEHPSVRGSCHQRNAGVRLTSGDPVIFTDDDVWLVGDCHEQLIAEYDRWGPELGGLCGSDLVPREMALPSVLWRRLFGMSTWRPEASGRMKAGFYVDGISRSTNVKRVEYMNGWLMSYRRAVLEEFEFDEAMPGYAQKEDMDLAYRVSRKYIIARTPDAMGKHYKAGAQRLSKHQLLRVIMSNQFYLHRKNMPQTPRHTAALWWAQVGVLTLNTMKAIKNRDPDYVTGWLVGAWEQMRRQGLVDPALEDSKRTAATQ
jgi:glycosyltransferase involved in cell wall biosynthesis